MSKFLPSEFFPYARFWETKPAERSVLVANEFKVANDLHNRRNKHHWEHWVTDKHLGIAKPMDEMSLKEMLVDWRATGLAYHGVDDSSEYFNRNNSMMTFHPTTRQQLERYFNIRYINH